MWESRPGTLIDGRSQIRRRPPREAQVRVEKKVGTGEGRGQLELCPRFERLILRTRIGR